jgi:hypothetical protein
MTSLLSLVTESTPSSLTPSPYPEVLEFLLVLLSESLWAPETDDTYESSILVASPSVQSISFPEPTRHLIYLTAHYLRIQFSGAEPTEYV